MYVTGGGELTVTSSAASTTIDNARFEVSGFSKLILDVPGLTMTGIYQSVSYKFVFTLKKGLFTSIPREHSGCSKSGELAV